MGGGSDSPGSEGALSSDELSGWEDVASERDEEEKEEEEEEREEPPGIPEEEAAAATNPPDVTPEARADPREDATWQALRGAAPTAVVAVLLHFLLVVIMGGLLVLQDRRHGAEISLLKARVATLSKKQELPGVKRRLADLEERVGAIHEHLLAESLVADRDEAFADFSAESASQATAGAAADKDGGAQQPPGDVWAAVSALQVAASRVLKAVVAPDQESSQEDSGGADGGSGDPMRDVGDAAWQLVAEAKARAAAAVNWLQNDSGLSGGHDAGTDLSCSIFGQCDTGKYQQATRLRARVRALEEALQEQAASSRQRLEAMNRRLKRLQKRHAETARRLLKTAAAAGVEVADGGKAGSRGGGGDSGDSDGSGSGSTALRLSPQHEELAAGYWRAQLAFEGGRGGNNGSKNGGGGRSGAKQKGKKDGQPGNGGGGGGGHGDGHHHKKKHGKNVKQGK